MSYIYIFYIHIVTMHAISISSTFYSLYILASYAYSNSSDYIIILYCFTLALMYPFMLLCTLYFICTAPENIVVWRFIN